MNKPIRYVIWDGNLWTQILQSSLPPINPTGLSNSFLKKVKSLNAQDLKRILPANFTERQISEILHRRDLLLAHLSK